MVCRPALILAVLLACAVPQCASAEGSPSPDRAYVDAVLDGLAQLGLLTSDQVRDLRTRGEMAAQDALQSARAAASSPRPAVPKWYDAMKVSGWMQGRWQYYPHDLEVRDASGDKRQISNEFLLKRARLVIDARSSADTRVYVQSEYSDPSGLSLKDFYLDRYLGDDQAHRVRVGQQKVPFGFEVVQSPLERLPLEDNWTTRRTIPGLRDTGVTWMYTTPEDATLFAEARSKWFGAGDYGNVAVSVLNGQGVGPEAQEVNGDKHVALRLAKPFALRGDGKYAEVGASYYAGDYFSKGASAEFSEHLTGVHGFIAPTPLGFQAEYFEGRTEGHEIDGWYAMGLWRTGPRGTAFLRHEDMDGWRKGANKADSRHRTSVGYAHQLSFGTRLTLEYDHDVLDDAGGRADIVGVQVQTRF